MEEKKMAFDYTTIERVGSLGILAWIVRWVFQVGFPSLQESQKAMLEEFKNELASQRTEFSSAIEKLSGGFSGIVGELGEVKKSLAALVALAFQHSPSEAIQALLNGSEPQSKPEDHS